MKIDCELTDEEKGALAMMMGMATGLAAFHNGDMALARVIVRMMNKIYALSPDYIPYDESTFNPNSPGFPFKRITPQ